MRTIVNGKIQYWLLALFFAYRPISLTINIDKGNNILAILEYLLLFYLLANDSLFRKVCSYKLCIIWFLLISYHFFNNIYQNVPRDYSIMSMFNSLFNCYFIMVYTCYLALKNEKKTLWYMLGGYLVFIILAALKAAETSDYTFGAEGERLNGPIHLTQMGATAGMIFCIFAYLKNIYRLRWLIVFLLSAIPIVVIIAVGSRNGLMFMFVGMVALVVAPMFRKLSFSKTIRLVIGILVLIYIANYFFENTYVGERLMTTNEQVDEIPPEFQVETGTILDMLGDRTWYYVVGWDNFINNPLFGIGYDNFRYVNETIWIVHPEYMLQIAEGGLVAICLFFTFILVMGYNLFKKFFTNHDARSTICCMFYLMTIIACFSTQITHSVQYWPLLGFCLSTFIVSTKPIDKKETSLIIY